MKFRSLTRRFAGALQTGSSLPDPVMPAPIFRERIRHERDCADRNHHSFSIITFESLLKMSGRYSEKFLTEVIRENIRSTDLLGKLDKEQMAVLLLYTSPVGAALVAQKISKSLRSHDLNVKISLRTYPKDFNSNASKESDLSKELIQDLGTAAEQDHSKPPEVRGDLETSTSQSDIRIKALSETTDVVRIFTKKAPLAKTAFDVVAATGGLIVMSPIFVVVGLAIKLSSRGPIIFKQTRIGLGEKPFTLYKFRSMQTNAEKLQASLQEFNDQAGPVFKMKRDPRITAVGAFIRKWSIDELPQLWNILKGDMSIIGPRPLICEEAKEYRGWHRSRFSVKPGLTCIWQVSGRSEIQFEQRIRMDVNYAKSSSFWLDFLILLKTIPAVFSAKGAY